MSEKKVEWQRLHALDADEVRELKKEALIEREKQAELHEEMKVQKPKTYKSDLEKAIEKEVDSLKRGL